MATATVIPSRCHQHRNYRSTSRRRCSEHVFVERVIEKSSLSIVYPTLTRTNYTEWSLVIKVNLQAEGLWDVIWVRH
jgi:hypothetical protein